MPSFVDYISLNHLDDKEGPGNAKVQVIFKYTPKREVAIELVQLLMQFEKSKVIKRCYELYEAVYFLEWRYLDVTL